MQIFLSISSARFSLITSNAIGKKKETNFPQAASTEQSRLNSLEFRWRKHYGCFARWSRRLTSLLCFRGWCLSTSELCRFGEREIKKKTRIEKVLERDSASFFLLWLHWWIFTRTKSRELCGTQSSDPLRDLLINCFLPTTATTTFRPELENLSRTSRLMWKRFQASRTICGSRHSLTWHIHRSAASKEDSSTRIVKGESRVSFITKMKLEISLKWKIEARYERSHHLRTRRESPLENWHLQASPIASNGLLQLNMSFQQWESIITRVALSRNARRQCRLGSWAVIFHQKVNLPRRESTIWRQRETSKPWQHIDPSRTCWTFFSQLIQIFTLAFHYASLFISPPTRHLSFTSVWFSLLFAFYDFFSSLNSINPFTAMHFIQHTFPSSSSLGRIHSTRSV